MKWYFKIAGGHTHVRVFVNGAKCGDLCFRNDEFQQIREKLSWVQFADETPTPPKTHDTTIIWKLDGKAPEVEMDNPAA